MQTEMIGKLIVKIIANKLMIARHEYEHKKEAAYFYNKTPTQLYFKVTFKQIGQIKFHNIRDMTTYPSQTWQPKNLERY
jgi:hypothetical protein